MSVHIRFIVLVNTNVFQGQTPLETRVREVELAVAAGATEIDIVINRTLVLEGRWEQLYDEVSRAKTFIT